MAIIWGFFTDSSKNAPTELFMTKCDKSLFQFPHATGARIDDDRPTMVVSLTRFAGSLLLVLNMTSFPRFAESIRRPSGPKRTIGGENNNQETTRRIRDSTASGRFRSLQTDKQQQQQPQLDNNKDSASTPAASPTTSKSPGTAVGGGTPTNVNKGLGPVTATPVAAPTITITPPTTLFTPVMAPVTSSTTSSPVFRFDPSWFSPPSLSPVSSAGDSPSSTNATTGGDDQIVATTNTTSSFSFTMTTNPTALIGQLLVQLEQYMPGASVMYNATDTVYTVTSPTASVANHTMAMLDVEALQMHMQQRLGETFTIVDVQIQQPYDDDNNNEPDAPMNNNNNNNTDGSASIVPTAGVTAPAETPTTETVERKYTKKDIALLIAFGISVTVIIAGITSVYCWKREIDETELEDSSRHEWMNDIDKEDELGVAETLSSSGAAAATETVLSPTAAAEELKWTSEGNN
jgi:hypothetical protein